MITIMYANSNDRWIRSDSGTYGNVLFGNNLTVNNDDVGVAGQTYYSGTYYVRQYFVEFAYSRTSDQVPVSGYFRFHNNVTHGTNVSRNTEIREFDWGGTVDTSDWRKPSTGLGAAEISGQLERSDNYANDSSTYAGFMRIRGELTSTSATLRYVLATDRNRRQNTPSGVEYNSFRSTRASGTSQDPQLVIGHHTLNRMTTVLAGQVQLSDGSWIVLERDSSLSDEIELTVKHITDSSETTVYAFPVSEGIVDNDNFRSAQGYGLCRDKNDNFFIVRPAYSNTTQIQVRGFVKSGSTWTLGGELSYNAHSDHGYANIMQVVCAWHDVGSGRIVAYATRDWGVLGGAMESYYLLDADKILNNQSGFVLDSGRGGDDGFTAKPTKAGPWSQLNGTGTLCDIAAATDHDRVGYLLSGERHALLGENNTLSLGRYFIHSGGEQFNSFTFAELDTNGGRSTYDPDSKARVIAVDGLNAVKLSTDSRTDWGLTMDRFSYNTNNNNYSRVGQSRLDTEGITSMPSASALSTTATWDAVYFEVDNSVWIYYFDTANSRQLLRTSISLDDNLATREEIVVDSDVGVSGDTMHAIRVQRNNLVSDEVLITVSKESSGGAHSYEYIIDRINVAPTQPTLHPVSNFNATSSKEFTWTFESPNLNNEQTAFQLRILDASDSSTVHDTGKTVSGSESYTLSGSTIANDENYFWQVKTWDVEDAESPWSSQGSFSTSASGVVDITYPATDLEELFDKDILLQWDVVPENPDEYRVTVVRTEDGATFLDTGWITSTDTEYLVENIVSDVEYEFRVKTRNSLVESNEATRLVLTHYNTPEIPLISVDVTTDLEYVTVSVTNPTPRGDRPNPTVNEVYRRVVGSGTPYLLVGECDIDSTFRDYTVGSGYRYEYKVRAGVEE